MILIKNFPQNRGSKEFAVKYKNFIFMSILGMSTLYGMDVKKHTPQLQMVTNKDTFITFKKKTKPFEYWMLHKRDALFGENRLFEYIDKHKCLTPINSVNIPSGDHASIHLAYISNLEKRYIDIDHKKYVMLGAFLLYDSRILIDNPIKVLTNYYAQNIPKPIRLPKLLLQKEMAHASCAKEEKEPQERGSVIMQNLFELIETHGKPEDLRILTTAEDLELLCGNSSKEYPIAEIISDEQPKPKRSRHSLSRRPSGHIPKLSTRKFSTRKPKDLRDSKNTES